MKYSILTDKIKFETLHSNKCLIDLDSDDEEISCSFVESDQNQDPHDDDENGDKDGAPLKLNNVSKQLQNKMMAIKKKNQLRQLEIRREVELAIQKKMADASQKIRQ